MKRIIVLFVSIVLVGNIFAQNTGTLTEYVIKVTDTHESFNKIGTKEAITVNIFDRDAQTIKKEWAKLMSKTYFSDKAEWKNISFIDNVSIKEISKNTVDIYGMVKYSTTGDVTFSIAIDLGGLFLTKDKHKAEYEVMKKIMFDFGYNQSKEGLQEKIYSQNELLKTFTAEKEATGKEIFDNNSKISEYKQKIAEAESEIKRLEQKNVEKQAQIEKQRALIFQTQSIIIK